MKNHMHTATSHRPPAAGASAHTHVHDELTQKKITNRLAKAIGHLQAVKAMVEHGSDCSDVLIQLSAVKAALNKTGHFIMQEHMEHCVVEAVQDGDTERITAFLESMKMFIK